LERKKLGGAKRVFRSVPVDGVVTDARTFIELAARDIARSHSEVPNPPAIRVVEVEAGVACLVIVWPAAQLMPTARAERKRIQGGRAECKQDILEVVREAALAMTRKQIVKALRVVGKEHGPGTIAKALADLTMSGELVNPQDKKGYRLPGWIQRHPALWNRAGTIDEVVNAVRNRVGQVPRWAVMAWAVALRKKGSELKRFAAANMDC
jgi:hypothetical protein